MFSSRNVPPVRRLDTGDGDNPFVNSTMLPLPVQRNYTGERVVGAPAFGDPARPPVLSSTYSGDMYFTDKLNEIYSSIHLHSELNPRPELLSWNF